MKGKVNLKIIKDCKPELPVVIPFLVYHGRGNWNYQKDLREMILGFQMLPEYLKQMLPVLRHDFINITGHNEEDIQKYQPVTRMVLRTLKYIFGDEDKLIEAFLISIEEIQSVVTEERLNYIVNIILIYCSSVNKNLTEADIIQKIQELGGKGAKIMTILEQREKKGIRVGLEQGLEQGMQVGRQEEKRKSAKTGIMKGYDLEIIMDMTGLTEEEIEEIRKEMLN